MTPPRSIAAVLGRPASGVSSTLARTCNVAAVRGLDAVLACWERTPDRWAGVVENAGVRIPAVLGWDTGTLAAWSANEGIASGTVVAIDYLGLVQSDKAE